MAQRVSDAILKERGEQLGAIAQEHKALNEQARALMQARRDVSPVDTAKIPLYISRALGYIETQRNNRQPLTIAGFVNALDISQTTLERWRKGERDNVLYEYMMLHNIPESTLDDADPVHIDDDGQVIPLITFSRFVEKYVDIPVQNQLETNCYTNKGNPAGSIFGLKARFGWQDTPQQVGTLNQTLVIADKEQAVKALEMLK